MSFQILSDQAANFVGGTANYLDPNLNIALPIFTIHGNHDDPTGTESLSAVDVLSSCRLVNYFGKHSLGGSNIGKVTLSPILIQKGTARLALYGLGSVRDERLARLFAQVREYIPESLALGDISTDWILLSCYPLGWHGLLVPSTGDS